MGEMSQQEREPKRNFKLENKHVLTLQSGLISASWVEKVLCQEFKELQRQ